jgi:hypothetical protein
MSNKLTRPEVYILINGEREYQDWRWGTDLRSVPGTDLRREGLQQHSPQEWLTYIQDYTNEALHIGVRKEDSVAEEKQMAIIRKIGGMAVAAMEQLGAPARSTRPVVRAR